MYYLNLFFFFSFGGLIYENIVNLIIDGKFQDNFMYGPWIPVYGFAIFLILGTDKFLKRRNIDKFWEITLYFIIITVLITILEFIAGHSIYLISGEVFWNYSSLKYNIGQYIALEVSLVWGIFSIIINYVIYPKIATFIQKIPEALTVSLSIGFVLDLILTIIKR